MDIYPKSQHYYNRYVKFIKSRKQDSKISEKHHIIPKSMGGSNDESNIIKLTFREHFIAHWLLWKAFDNQEMTHAFWFMSAKKMGKLTSRTFENLKESRREVLIGTSYASGKRSDESKEKMRQAQLNTKNHSTRGKKRPEHSDRMRGENNPFYGKPSPMKGMNKPILTCPHCGKEGGQPQMIQWHFDKCKLITK